MPPKSIRAGLYAGPSALARAAGYSLARHTMRAGEEPEGADEAATDDVPTLALVDGEWALTVDGAETRYATRAEAFAAFEESTWFTESLGRKHPESWHALAPLRFVDAAAVEDIPAAHDGSQIQAQFIDEMVRNLGAAKTAPPVDGAGVSQAHETIYNGDAKSPGRIFAGLRVTGEDEQPHLWLWIRVTPDIDAEMDEQLWSFGSIAFVAGDSDRYTDQPIGARLVSYALTNFPFVDDLEPHQPRVERSTKRNRAGAWLAITRSRNIAMPNKKPAPAARSLSADEITKRGPVGDKLAEIYKSLGLDMNESDYWKVCDALSALKTVATAENAVEGGAPAPAGDDAARAAAEAEAKVRAEDAAKMEAFAAEAMAALKDIFGQPEADAAALLDLLKASSDAFKGAVQGDKKPADNAGEGGQDAEGERAAKAEAIALRAQVKANGEELAKLRAEVRARQVQDYVDAKYRSAKLNPPQGKDREELLALCDKAGDEWQRMVDFSLRSVNVPPSGTAIDDKDARPVVPAGAGDSDEVLLATARAEILEKDPNIGKKALRSQSYALAMARKAELTKTA